MRKRKLLALSFIALLALLQGCASFIGATTDGPIDQDRTERTLGAALDDQFIETKALVNIRKAHPELESAHISVVSYNGVLLLVGQVPSEQLRQLAAKTAANIQRVKRVHNELAVKGKTSMIVRSNDSWITTKVKSRLVLDEDVDASGIKVVTENGVVYLMGLVTQQTAEKASEIARTTNGVQKVVRVFEYI